MEGTPRLYETLVQGVNQHQHWLDRRHLKTLAWMMVGRRPSGHISLTAWVPQGHSRARLAQSPVRRVPRWLAQERIAGQALDGPLLQQALAEGSDQRVSLALDTSMWWKTSGLVRLARVQRGRAVPLVWTVLEHPSSRVADHVDNARLEKGAELRPFQCSVVLTADRGCAAPPLLAHRTRWGWHWRMRIHGSVWISRAGQRVCNVQRIRVAAGQALCWHHVYLTTQESGPVHLALGRPLGRTEDWLVGSDEATEAKTFAADGWRFDIEANVFDDPSHGFQLESSLSRSATA